MIGQITNNWICWAILLLAVFCYQKLWQQYLNLNIDSLVHQPLEADLCATLTAALPLLGLLGTIVGLLDCFAGMALEGASGALLSGGIGDALFTTQLGLICALPAWIFQSVIRARVLKFQLLTEAK